jgi:DNA-binding NarL/FixJ family response regulator
VRAIRAVNSGEAIFGPSITQRLMQYFAIQRAPAPPTIFPQLTDREREILAMIVQGLNNADIADRLEVSLKTVRNHVSNIFSKLQVADRTEAVNLGRQAGLPTSSGLM